MEISGVVVLDVNLNNGGCQ